MLKKNKEILNELVNNPNWSEVVKLYSGLFENEYKREEFVIDLAKEDVLLAAQCKTTSVEEEINITSAIKKDAINNFKKDPRNTVFALLEIEAADELFFSQYSAFRNPFGKRDRKLFDELLINSTAEQYISYLSYVSKLKHNTFLIWSISFAKKFIFNTEQIENLKFPYELLFKRKYYNFAYELFLIINKKNEEKANEDFVYELLKERRKDSFRFALKIILKHKLKCYKKEFIYECLSLKNKQLKKINPADALIILQ